MEPSRPRAAQPGGDGRAGEILRWAATIAGRVLRAFRRLPTEGRMAALAALGLFLSLFLPWYQTTVVGIPGSGQALLAPPQSLTGWGAFSFVEAAVLLVAAGTLTLLFQRAEGRAFHVPGGDGTVVMAAGGWTCVLVVWRIFDKQSTTTAGRVVIGTGIEWGIFVALLVAAFLGYSGWRMRIAHVPEPPLPGEREEDPTEPFASSSEQLTIPLHGELHGDSPRRRRST